MKRILTLTTATLFASLFCLSLTRAELAPCANNICEGTLGLVATVNSTVNFSSASMNYNFNILPSTTSNEDQIQDFSIYTPDNAKFNVNVTVTPNHVGPILTGFFPNATQPYILHSGSTHGIPLNKRALPYLVFYRPCGLDNPSKIAFFDASQTNGPSSTKTITNSTAPGTWCSGSDCAATQMACNAQAGYLQIEILTAIMKAQGGYISGTYTGTVTITATPE